LYGGCGVAVHEATEHTYAPEHTEPMTYLDGQKREMAKWSHHGLDAARRRTEDARREALSEDASACSGMTEDWYVSTG